MRKMILVLAMVFVIAGCSTGGEGSRAGESQFEHAPTVTTTTVQTTGPISDDPTEETIIQGYIKAARQFLDQGAIQRDAVTVELIQSELSYVDADQAEAIRKAILK